MHFIIIILVFWLGWLPGLAFAQVYEAFTGSANFPSIGITCIGNLAAFIRFILLNKLQFEDLPTQVLVIRVGLHLLKIEGVDGGLTTSTLPNCHVVMLSRQTPNISMQRFMDYISRVYGVHSIFLPCRPIKRVEDSVQICTNFACTKNQEGGCGCIVFNTEKDITMMLARQMPGTVKRLSDSRILLSSLRCLRNGCHGCNQGLLHVESPAAVCEILDLKSINKVRSCICIPVRSADKDKWINQLITLLKPDDKEFRGTVIREGRTNPRKLQ